MIVAPCRKRTNFSIQVQGDVTASRDASDAGEGDAANGGRAAQRSHGCRMLWGDGEKQFVVLTAIERQLARRCLVGGDCHGGRSNGKRVGFEDSPNLAGFAQPGQVK